MPQEPEKAKKPAISASRIPIDGFLSLRYRLRDSDKDGSDQDLMGLLSLQIGDPLRHRFTAHLLGSMNWDMDGNTSSNVFNGIYDTYDGSVRSQLYDAYIDVHRLPSLEIVRLGRQSMYESPVPVSFDGLRVETEELGPQRIRIGAYSGISNHLYDASVQGDFLIGAFLEGVPWKRGRLRCDWLHASDETTLQDHNDDLVGFQLWQGVWDYGQLRAGYTMLGGESRDVEVRGTSYFESWDLQLQASYYELLKTQGSLALEFDPFYASAFDYYPYYQFRALVTKGFGERFNVTSGVDLRRMTDQSDEGKFNRDYDHVYLTPMVEDVLVDGLSVSLTGDYWGSDGGEDVTTWAADASMKASEQARMSIGTYYALYKTDLGTDGERNRVRTFYVTTEYRIENVRLRLGYEYEHDDDDDYHQLDARITWTF